MSNIDYVITARRIKNNQFDSEPGPVRYLRVPRRASIPTPEHQTKGRGDLAKWVQEVRELSDQCINPNSISPKGDVLIFLHGYNNDLKIIMERQRQLAKDLKAEGWEGVVIGFDWPSHDSTLNYLEDRSDAAEVALQLVAKGIKVLADGQGAGCEANIHLIGHSTGAYVIMEAFSQAEKDGELYKSDWRVGQTVFIGGDVSSKSLSSDSQWAKAMFHRIMRLTNYSNPFDSVLGVSNAKRLGVSARAGRVGLPKDAHDKAVNVQCGDYFQSLDPDKSTYFGTFNHSWHIGNRVFARDLAMTLEGAIDRNALPTRIHANNQLILQDKPRPKYMQKWGISDRS
ncbi:MAG: alpha/beta fold hydrolase [Cohaesibacter sp.]|nr:alpha/beta fold hydrolase [Cohaesibacter sp.]